MADWTEEEMALCKQLADEGLSASQIAAQLGTKSRNAIIGKMNRMKLVLRGTRPPRRRRERIVARTGKFIPPIEYVYEEEEVDIDRKDGIEFVDLNFKHCRWPYGTKNEYYYCGKERIPDSSYCGHHEYKSRRRIIGQA